MASKHDQPSRLADRLVIFCCKGTLQEEILGDLYEYWVELSTHPNWKRNTFYWFHVFHFLRPSLLKKLSGTYKLNIYGMIKLLVKTSFRNIAKHKLVSFMSLLTLIFGAVCFQLVYSWVYNEQSMDQMHTKGEQVHIALAKLNPKGDFFALPVEYLFNVDFKQFAHVAEVINIHTYGKDEIKLIADGAAYEGKALIVDSAFFEYFDFELQQGRRDALYDPSSVVITEDYAQQVFGRTDVLGETVEVKCDQSGLYQIAGVVKKIPSNSSIHFDFLVPRHSKNFWRRIPQNLLLTDEFFDPIAFNDEIEKLGRSSDRFPESTLSTVAFNTVYHSRPFDIPLFSKYGDKTSLQIMQVVAFLILLITVISFVNLQTTLYLTMTKKTGIKKIMGAGRLDMGLEIMISRVLYLLIGVLAAFLIYQWVFPYYVTLMELDLDAKPFFDLQVISLLIAGTMLISLLALLGKSFAIKPILAISGKFNSLKIPRIQWLLNTVQYGITVLLLVATVVVFFQLEYMLNKDAGIATRNIIKTDFFEILPSQAQDSVTRANRINQYNLIVDRIRRHPSIEEVSQGSMPFSSLNSTSWKVKGSREEATSENSISVDPGYASVLDIELTDGRFFSDLQDNNRDFRVVINEAARKYWDIDNIENTKLVTNTRGNSAREYSIIGVVNNYHYQHLSHNIKPLVMSYSTYLDQSFLIKYKDGMKHEAVAFLDEIYREVNPGGILSYESLEDKINDQYAQEKRISRINLGFGLVALLLASIGLFTFSYHESKRRTKEIGIRKVNGARPMHAFFALSQSFLTSILISFLVACPLAWYLMQKWLEDFANRIDITWWMFATVGIGVMLIALLTTSWQTWEAAKKNPVESLRYE